ncbi:hypothetical protein SAPIG1185 [Staphylococcus aureus subsp. aureus ST398]|nr:hypothetical protein SAPIG1185 [Staphylococcus aureus subsp. aureus ST398]
MRVKDNLQQISTQINDKSKKNKFFNKTKRDCSYKICYNRAS